MHLPDPPWQGVELAAARFKHARVCTNGSTMCITSYTMRRYIRKNITLPAAMDARLRKPAKARGASQSGMIVHLVALGLAAESGDSDPLLRYLGPIAGPRDL